MGSKSAIYKNAALTGTAILVKTGPCSLNSYHIFNTTTAECYVQFFDAAAAADVTVGTSPTFVLGIPAETAAGLGSGACCAIPKVIQFTLGLVVASTTAADGSTGAIVSILLGIGD